MMIDIEDLVRFIKSNIKTGSRIFVQIPAGLIKKASEIAGVLEKHGYEVIISMESCYGACDLRDYEARVLNCDVLLHIGHERIKNIENHKPLVKVLFYPLEIEVKIKEEELKKIREHAVGLVTLIQHRNSLSKFAKLLSQIGKKAVICGVITGCDYSVAKQRESEVDCFLLIASGRFHAIGLASVVNKPVYIYDVEGLEVREIRDLRIEFEKIKLARLHMLEDAKKIAFLISTKPGQLPNWKLLKELKAVLEKMGKSVLILSFDNITNEKLLGLDVDYLVNFACPRIVEDYFDKPIVNAIDLWRFLNKGNWIHESGEEINTSRNSRT